MKKNKRLIISPVQKDAIILPNNRNGFYSPQKNLFILQKYAHLLLEVNFLLLFFKF
jgi:hypothetical protein